MIAPAPHEKQHCDTQRAAQALTRADPTRSGKQRAAFGHSADSTDRQPSRKRGAPSASLLLRDDREQWRSPLSAPL
jgi:hypothetical protein